MIAQDSYKFMYFKKEIIVFHNVFLRILSETNGNYSFIHIFVIKKNCIYKLERVKYIYIFFN